MPKMNTGFAQEPVLVEDRYPATLKECTEYEKDYGEGPVPKVAWVFDVEAPEGAIDPDIEYEGGPPEDGIFEIAAHTSLATGPNSNFAKLNFPAIVGENWDGDTDSVIGTKCLVDVTSYETKGGQIRNVIEKVRKPKKGKTQRTAAEKEEEEDFDQLPV